MLGWEYWTKLMSAQYPPPVLDEGSVNALAKLFCLLTDLQGYPAIARSTCERDPPEKWGQLSNSCPYFLVDNRAGKQEHKSTTKPYVNTTLLSSTTNALP